MKPVLVIPAISAALLFAAPALADSVVVNGTTYTCSNACVITVSGSSSTVRDCCGGRVSVSFGKIEE